MYAATAAARWVCAWVALAASGFMGAWFPGESNGRPADSASAVSALDADQFEFSYEYRTPRDGGAPAVPPEDDDSNLAAPERGVRITRTCRVTAYCDRGITACGIPSGVGQCAAPADIPLGSRVFIPALGRTFIVTDRTHKRFRHNTIDIFMPSRDSCLAFGRRYLEAQFHIHPEPPRYGSPAFAVLVRDRYREN
ncbi:MAG: 3D domain-containing protein [Phycisphaerae bacterium]